MADLLGEINKKKPSSLTRGKEIKTDISITKQDILDPKQDNTDLLDANIRVNKKMRNQITAIGIVGYGDSRKETVEILLDTFLSTIPQEEYKKIEGLCDIYRDKDAQINNKKK